MALLALPLGQHLVSQDPATQEPPPCQYQDHKPSLYPTKEALQYVDEATRKQKIPYLIIGFPHKKGEDALVGQGMDNKALVVAKLLKDSGLKSKHAIAVNAPPMLGMLKEPLSKSDFE